MTAQPVERLDGWLVPKMPKNLRHRGTTLLIRTALERLSALRGGSGETQARGVSPE